MDEVDTIHFPTTRDRATKQPKAILLTSYNTGACEGKNLGIAGYSHDIVAKLFIPLLSRWGEVVVVPDPHENLETAVREARERNLDPVHFSILPLQDVCLAQTAPNIVVPAWEFPDVPDHEFGGNPQNNWPATADRCDTVLVGGPFTLKALRKAGTTAPIYIVPVPTPKGYFEVPSWNSAQQMAFSYSAIELPQEIAPLPSINEAQAPVPYRTATRSRLKRFGQAVESRIRQAGKAIVPQSLYERFQQAFRAGKAAYRSARKPVQTSWDLNWNVKIPYHFSSKFELSGVVYTSILNPVDGRKNWTDLITGFLFALGDREDATLVIKLIASNPYAVETVIDYYYQREIPHRCKVIFVTDYLSEEQLQQLSQASTYYLQATKAEGNCLPLMNYLAAGRPGISPCHSAIADYFDDGVGFVVESHPEPSAWPHDPRLRIRSTWARVVWTSLVEQIRASYDLVKTQPEVYQAMATRARERMNGWASEDEVWNRLCSALDATVQGEDHNSISKKHESRAHDELRAHEEHRRVA
jgi:hypothetical protein